ncbi:glycosyltransferase family 4 protein [Phormidesmis priestleyi]|uniref:glycosyltransferase family 4 protein n=1 Tax=Phormidesmis priestleyi TaxID=268141 RepID=UPI00083A6651|nr:glycosyltransferase family 4 protein [Phormidesmis priestleyi]
MKILVLTWEFPPRIVGGIARHVAELYPELVRLGHEIHLITVQFGQAPHYEVVDGVGVHRVSVDESQNFLHWVVNMNASMGQHGGKLIREEGAFDIIHAHDWLVGDAAIALKYLFKIPLVATIHATEGGRNNGVHTEDQRYVNEKERCLTHDAWRVIVCTDYMRREVERSLHTPWNKIDVVYNGIRAEKKLRHPGFDVQEFRRRFAGDDEKIVYYVGRMTYEKGISVLLSAAPKVLQAMGTQVKFVFIGGGNTDYLKSQAWNLGIWQACFFTGFMLDEDLDKFQTIANCAVFPSLYEPFGIVALESFAARVPVVVSDSGGLPEVVRHNRTGIVTWTGNSDSLAWGIIEVLKNPDYSQWLVENAFKDLEVRFHWAKLAKQTEAVYGRVLHERSQVEW